MHLLRVIVSKAETGTEGGEERERGRMGVPKCVMREAATCDLFTILEA
jgi:hypothetical protein